MGLVVGVDGSASARQALHWAVDEAELRKDPLLVLAVQAIPKGGLAPLESFPDEKDRQRAETAARRALEEVTAARGGSLAVSATVRAVIGNPAEELLKAAKDADLLVVGSRGAGGFSRLVLGSVSTAMVHHADCPVVVVRPRRRRR